MFAGISEKQKINYIYNYNLPYGHKKENWKYLKVKIYFEFVFYTKETKIPVKIPWNKNKLLSTI